MSKSFDVSRERHTSLKAAVLSFKRAPTEKVVALKEIDLSIQHGETVAVIGRNGSGKSTLLRIVGRVYRPSTGTVEVDGRMSTMLDLGAGFHPELTGRENIYFNGAIMGLKTAEIESKLDRIIEFSELEDFVDTPVGELGVKLGFAQR